MKFSPKLWKHTSLLNLRFIFVVALSLRIGVFLLGPYSDPNRAMTPDSGRYLKLGENLRDFYSFGLVEIDGVVQKSLDVLREKNGTLPMPDENGLRPESFRTPGYPFFIAVLYSFWNDRRFVLLVQSVLGAAMACLVVSICKTLGASREGSFLAGFIWAVHPALVLHDNLFMSESLFNVFIVAAVGTAATAGSRLSYTLGSGFLIGIANLVRPLGFLYLPFCSILIWQRSHSARQRAFTLVLFFFLAFLPSLSWTLRNYTVGEGLRLTSVSSINLLYYTAAYTIAEEKGKDWGEGWSETVFALSEEVGRRLAPGADVIKTVGELGWEKVLEHPLSVLQIQSKAMVKLLFAHSLADGYQVFGVEYTPSGVFSKVILMEEGKFSKIDWKLLLVPFVWLSINFIIVLLAIYGAYRAMRKRMFAVVIMCVATVLLFAVATNSVGLERMRVPIMLPLLCLGAFSLESKRMNGQSMDAKSVCAEFTKKLKRD